MGYVVGIDGGGTQTTVAIADEFGREIARRTGAAGIVDPYRPRATAELLTLLTRELVGDTGLTGPASALCAGLAGAGNLAEREAVRSALRAQSLADHVDVRSDGEVALQGAFADAPGIMLIAGTGSVGWGRSVNGRVERCGGWGRFVGDEGSGYQVGRDGLIAALHAEDGRGPPTALLPTLLGELGFTSPEEIPPWIARAEKAEVAALAVYVVVLAEQGDVQAAAILRRAAEGLAAHAEALAHRLAPWAGEIAVVLHGGLGRHPLFRELAETALHQVGPFRLCEPRADPVGGALQLATRALAA